MKRLKRLDMDKINRIFNEHFEFAKDDLEKGLTIWTLTPKRTVCTSCQGKGYVHSNNEQGADEVQKCDDCGKYKTDEQAQQVAYNPHCPKCTTKLLTGKLVSEGYDFYCPECDEDFCKMEIK
jgi:hypothetical protein